LEGKITIVMSGDWPHKKPASPALAGFRLANDAGRLDIGA
jgi:hypothetical protein